MIIASSADYARDHYIFRRETNRRDGSTFSPSKPLPNYALRAVLIVGAAILVIVWVVVR